MVEKEEIPSGAFALSAAVFYGLMGGVAVLWVWLRGQPLLTVMGPLPGGPLLPQVAIGLAFGGAVILLGFLLERYSTIYRNLSRELRSMLPVISWGHAFILALTSSVGEELFFRGAMQGHIGLWPTAFLFGFAHGFLYKQLRAWVVFAWVMGVCLGVMVQLLGSLWAPIVAHFTINFVNLQVLSRGRQEAPL